MALMEALGAHVGDEIEDPSEETFLLFSQPIPSQNLGIIDDKAARLDLTVRTHDFTIKQSPSVLNSARAGGTTGAVVWKVTPRFATWLSSPSNFLFRSGILTPASAVLELGAGIAGVVPVLVAPLVAKYIATDQSYALKLLQENVSANALPLVVVGHRAQKKMPRRVKVDAGAESEADARVSVAALDWETDDVASLLSSQGVAAGVDLVVASDCVYNYALIEPFVQCCADVCKTRRQNGMERECGEERETVVLVAQQLRQPDVLEEWLGVFHRKFRTWRVPEEELKEELGEGSGFVVHLGVLREDAR